jgi:hypothetical protein
MNYKNFSVSNNVLLPTYVLLLFIYVIVGIADWLGAGRPRGRSSGPGGGKDFYFIMSRPALGPTQPPIQWVSRDLSPGVRRPGRETDHSPTSAEVKKT